MSQHHRAHAAAIGIRSTLVGVVANILLAAVKAIAGILGNSYALIADAIESASDVGSSLVVLGGIKIASLPADGDHPYGHGKAEPLAAMIVAVALFTAAIGIAIESTREIITPHHAPAAFTLVVLVLVVVIKETLFRFVVRQGTRIQSTAVNTDAWHHRSDAMTSAAAFVGISVALIGGEGYESADDYAALIAAVIIGFNAYRLLRPSLQEIMDAAPPLEIEEGIRAVASAVPGVRALDKCFVRKMGLEYFVDLHVIVEGGISVLDGHEIGHHVKDAIMRDNSGVADVLVHIEPTEVLTSFRNRSLNE
jgi:cation diffusion facilitator family transporter